MIIGMFPLPKRNFMIGNTFSGYDDKEMMMSEKVRSMISREIVDLPIFFYKLFGQFGMFQCEWVVASPSIIDVFNLEKHGEDILIPISCKYRGLIQPKRNAKIACQSTSGLFAKGIIYLLTQYPKSSALDPTVPIRPSRSISGWNRYPVANAGTLVGFLASGVERTYNMKIDGARLTDPIYSNMLLSSDAAFAANLISSLCDYSFTHSQFDFDPAQINIVAFVEDVMNTTGEEVVKYLTNSFFTPAVEPVSKILLMNPGYTPIRHLFPYISKDKETFSGLYNIAMQEANASANFDGSYLPCWSNQYGGCEAFTLIDAINNSLTTDFGVECSYSEIPNYACHDIFYPHQYAEHEQFYFKTLNVSVQDIFFDMSNSGVLAGFTGASVSRNMLDEIFIVASGNFGIICYYVPLPYYHLINPMIINMDQM